MKIKHFKFLTTKWWYCRNPLSKYGDLGPFFIKKLFLLIDFILFCHHSAKICLKINHWHKILTFVIYPIFLAKYKARLQNVFFNILNRELGYIILGIIATLAISKFENIIHICSSQVSSIWQLFNSITKFRKY